MITFITGVPGSGKTLYCIDKLLRDIVNKTETAKDKNNETVEVKRRLLTNIKGLLIDHELVDAEWLQNWHTHCKPGDVICYDEVQEVWKPRANGSKVPDDIGKLETHRHMGVDFILISQHPLLVDRNILQLVGRHLHVRRVSSIGAAVVYEWDHCSRSLLYKNSMTKWPWRYNKEVFTLYKSAELHTKQKRKMPGLVWFVFAGVLGFLWFAPKTYSSIMDKGKPPVVSSPASGIPGVSTKTAQAASAPASTALPPQVAQAASAPVLSGCASARKGKLWQCKCYDTKGKICDADLSQCEDMTRPAPVQLELEVAKSNEGGRVMQEPAVDAQAWEEIRRNRRLAFY